MKLTKQVGDAGKYDEIAERLSLDLNAAAVVLVVVGGRHGDGMSVALDPMRMGGRAVARGHPAQRRRSPRRWRGARWRPRHGHERGIVMTGPSTAQLIEIQNRLTLFADEGAVGLLSKTDVALLSWALGYASGGVEQGIPSPRASKAGAPMTRERAHELAEKSILTIAHNLEEIDAKDYADAVAQLKGFLASTTNDIAENKLDTGGVMLLGAACVTLLREAVLAWPGKIDHASVPAPLPVEAP